MTQTTDSRTEVWPEALALWQDDETARDFLEKKHPMLGNRRPYLVALESEDGARAVINIIGRARYGSFV